MLTGTSSFGFIAVHLGAGYHSKSKLSAYRKLVNSACKLGTSLCKDGHLASHIACEVVSLLENSDLTNAGYGSNLTQTETVQCDASLMDSNNNFAAVGCIENIMNPIKVAYDMLNYQNEENFGLVPPMVLVGEGAKQWAIGRGFSTVSDNEMISESALRTYQDSSRKVVAHFQLNQNDEQETSREKHYCNETPSTYLDPRSQDGSIDHRESHTKLGAFGIQKGSFAFGKSLREAFDYDRKRKSQKSAYYGQSIKECKKSKSSNNSISISEKMDTVGSICVDSYGNVCAAVSSGGLILKQSGRVGQAACYGCGCFVGEKEVDAKCHIICASSTSGCGEQLIKTLLAKHCVDSLIAEFNKQVCSRAGRYCDDETRGPFNNDLNYEMPACIVDDSTTDMGADCSKSCHTCNCSKWNVLGCSKVHNVEHYIDEIPNILDKGFLKSHVLKDVEKKIAGCINIRLIKWPYQNDSIETRKDLAKGRITLLSD